MARNGANGENRGVYVYLIHTNEETRKVMQIRQEAEWKMPKIRRLSEDRTKESGGSSRRSKGMESDARCFDVRHRPRVRCGSYLGTNHQARRLFFFAFNGVSLRGRPSYSLRIVLLKVVVSSGWRGDELLSGAGENATLSDEVQRG